MIRINLEEQIKLTELETIYIHFTGTTQKEENLKEQLLAVLKEKKALSIEETLRIIKIIFQDCKEEKMILILNQGSRNYFYLTSEQDKLKSYKHKTLINHHERFFGATAKYNESGLNFTFDPELIEREKEVENFVRKERKRIHILANTNALLPAMDNQENQKTIAKNPLLVKKLK